MHIIQIANKKKKRK